MTVSMGRLAAAGVAALVFALPLTAESTGPQAGARAELAAGRIVIEATAASSALSGPGARHRASRDLEAALPDIFMRFAPSLAVDSWDLLGSVAQQSETVLAALSDLSRQGRLEDSRMSEDLRSVRLAWSFPLFGAGGLVAALATHGTPLPLPRSLADAPTTRYSGVVIYAAEPLRAWGTTEERLPRPALFPRIYDTEMRLVLEKLMCDPVRLARWGMVAYSDNAADPGPADRIGINPLRILARGVFGRNDTDLLIPAESARRLLANDNNRRLLREGRILVIYHDVSPALAAAPQ